MLERIIRFSIENRVLVLFAISLLAALGMYNYQRLAIDAVQTSPMCRCRSIPTCPVIRRWRLNSA